MNTKWVIVTGGVISGIGKGTAVGAIGKLFSANYKVVPIKCDGYLNVDPGTMSPYQHGEVFVLDDGGEVDLDFGHYERFMNINCKRDWNITSGKVFDEIIKKERHGDYLGATVQIFPHVITHIKNKFKSIAASEKADIMLIEIGGTIGDIENSWFVEAVRELKQEVGQKNILYVHLTYVPYVESIDELKTKPAQRDVELLREKGIIPDVIIARSEKELGSAIKSKLALFCGVDEDAVISEKNIEKTVYEIPLMFEKERLLSLFEKKLGLEPKKDLSNWKNLVNKIKNPSKNVNVLICGKYVDVRDAYLSIKETLMHAGANINAGVNIDYLETTELDNQPIEASDGVMQKLKTADAMIVPIGFGDRGAEGKIKCIQYAREHNMPFLGLCFGLQLAVSEFARNVCGLEKANSTEINPSTPNPVIDLLPEQLSVTEKGATMRLGLYRAELKPGTKIQQLYSSDSAEERHRHRWEVNPKYHEILQRHGMVFSGTSRDGKLVEFIELPSHPYFVATQAHPEYRSRLEKPSPLFYGLVKAALESKK
jgi:CTP synthase